jgi:hypothetical protein
MGEQCPEPAPCAPGTYSGDGKNAGGDKACTDCEPGEYSTDAGVSIVFSLRMCYVTLTRDPYDHYLRCPSPCYRMTTNARTH